MVFENDIFLFEQRANYVVRRPIRYGVFNLQRGSAQDCLADI